MRNWSQTWSDLQRKNFQASSNEDASTSVEQAKQEKAAGENLNFLIDLATFSMVAEDETTIEEEPNMFD